MGEQPHRAQPGGARDLVAVDEERDEIRAGPAGCEGPCLKAVKGGEMVLGEVKVTQGGERTEGAH